MKEQSDLPDWLRLMRSWLSEGMGATGITLPFLAGALALKHHRASASADDLRTLLNTMVTEPLPGHFVGVRRCSGIRAPVLSSLSLQDPLIRKCELLSPNGQVSLAFSPDAMSSISGLDCNDGIDCAEKLVQYSAPHTGAGDFSRMYDQLTGQFTYSQFRAQELAFIQRVLGG